MGPFFKQVIHSCAVILQKDQEFLDLMNMKSNYSLVPILINMPVTQVDMVI